MNAKARNRFLWGMLPLALLLAGCGNYTITFEVADVINAWGEDVTREMLDVDIVCLTKKDADRHPSIVNGAMQADEWFNARDKDPQKIGDISPKQIYALRRGGPTAKNDTLIGESLLSAKDRQDGQRTTVVKVNHPQPFNDEAAIVIFGRFSSQMGIAKVQPLVIRPPGMKTKLLIKVGKQSMVLGRDKNSRIFYGNGG